MSDSPKDPFPHLPRRLLYGSSLQVLKQGKPLNEAAKMAAAAPDSRMVRLVELKDEIARVEGRAKKTPRAEKAKGRGGSRTASEDAASPTPPNKGGRPKKTAPGAWVVLGIGRSEYYRRKKAGEL